jgi:hypothetical protein
MAQTIRSGTVRIVMKVAAFIERGNDGTFRVYIDLEENRLNYGVIGEGNTVSGRYRHSSPCRRIKSGTFHLINISKR